MCLLRYEMSTRRNLFQVENEMILFITRYIRFLKHYLGLISVASSILLCIFQVLARNDACFITELPNKWHVDYDRRSKHQHTGFFAYNHVPYRTFGNLRHTDVYDLIGDKLGIVVQKHWHYMQVDHNMQLHIVYVCDHIHLI